ncbi:MAG: enolase C-terminal domain-like protein [Candidatus Levybacteria bacterium]|nr:enolase C-terminal domain-like protein [Candidatus Levybacteria bacterium]
MAKIKDIIAREILNSLGIPTVETTVVLNDGSSGTASSPTDSQTGIYEAAEAKDHDQNRFNGLGVLTAVKNIEDQIKPNLIGKDSSGQQEVDRIMIGLDGTQNKSRLGANAMLSVSMAVAKASSVSSVLPLFLYLREFIQKENLGLKIPTPIFTLIAKSNMGKMNFSEFLIVPASSKSLQESLLMGTSIFKSLRDVLESHNLSSLISDIGGFSPNIASNRDGLVLIKEAIDKTTQKIGFDAFFGLNSRASTFWNNGKYLLKDASMSFSSHDLTSYYLELKKEFDLLYLEDPFASDDWDGWADINTNISNQAIIAGSDLISTNPYRLQMVLDKKSATAIVIKLGQIGTVTEALAVSEMARHSGLKLIVSGRTGETNDDFIADFATAISADYVKFGGLARGERIAKYNRLLQIEKNIKSL